MLDLMLMMMCGEGDDVNWLHNKGGVSSNSRSEYYLQLSSNR